jgi:hypothetical protein
MHFPFTEKSLGLPPDGLPAVEMPPEGAVMIISRENATVVLVTATGSSSPVWGFRPSSEIGG